jgi:predicted MFS family arabinose efflux permease
MAGGYPLGATLGGLVSARLLEHFDWRAIFLLGGSVSLLLIVLVWFAVPESVAFLADSRRPDRLARVNAVLKRFGRPAVNELPEPPHLTEQPRSGFVSLVREHARSLILLTLSNAGLMVTAYFMLKWIPKIVVNLGHAPGAAAGVLVWSSIGGLVGTVAVGLLTLRVRIYWLAVVSMLLAGIFVMWFGRAGGGLTGMTLIAAAAGFAAAGATVGIYAVSAGTFPTALRATATGFVIGVGRAGSALSPVLTGILFAAGYDLRTVAVLMGTGALIGVVALLGAGGAARTGAHLAARAPKSV